MQNRYVGDIGDYVKHAILRALSPGRRLGVAWWLFPDSGPPGDGRHIGYLDAPEKWRHFDPDVFDELRRIVQLDCRTVAALENAGLLPGAIYFSEEIPAATSPQTTRVLREAWLARCQAHLSGCDLAFLDPDNGFATKSFSLGARSGGKSVSQDALKALRRTGRTLIVYHHHTRRIGGHDEELRYWANQLRSAGFQRVDVLRARPWSPRAFFLLDADEALRHRAKSLAGRWNGLITWHPDDVHPC